MTAVDEALLEELAEAAHDAWMDSKWSLGVRSCRSEWGEELMVPYTELSDEAKDVDRATVLGVLAALKPAGYLIVKAGCVNSTAL